jgi:hypothetical protein
MENNVRTGRVFHAFMPLLFCMLATEEDRQGTDVQWQKVQENCEKKY